MGRERLRAKPVFDGRSGRSPLPAGLQETEVESMARELLADRAANSSPGQSSVTSARVRPFAQSLTFAHCRR